MKNLIYLGLGSNIGNRAENIISALSFLQSSGFVKINKISNFYETSPVGPKQRDFYNIAAKAKTSLKPHDLLFLVKKAEEILGRKPSKRLAKRLIDIDILFYNDEITAGIGSGFRRNGKAKAAIAKAKAPKQSKVPAANSAFRSPLFALPLTIPHKEVCRRLFVLIPMAEIAPDYIHPVLNRKIKHILKSKLLTPCNQKVRIVSE
ncbi:MAG: 2-amino-4-hydroxy-6-hydroxymethyldihydropteridine diphosphokinase [Endomicrobium sp.]|jgi:2-amino-4-hydroxy-6-hydroxymethyldihydropteridine diphosphokinase|nr:2-amino-4-hydroxy-6-hydroxymethyldihydropteridine diphosphokinase [Endomicrobium sp.]